ncbi:hypothetical protein [Labilibaculum sp.]|uniref:hypothetical protein n=1 Tax=Labilibaculum sp. TaxID=2060723 RepID=UPI002AA8947C|nr:hypothetical protein [Labilibaculum sp.]
MNKLNFSNTGGFPLDTNVLAFMQDAYDLLNAMGELAGDLSILKGCAVTGSTVSDGVVYINGEVLAFKGGTGAQVIIKEDITELPFEDGSSKEVEKVRYATFGIASTSYAWTNFIRVQRAIVPRGLISMWSGNLASLPRGWSLCDGTNDTPDLRGRFIVGAGGAYDPGANGGNDSIALSSAQLPSHSHGAGSLQLSDTQLADYIASNNNTLSHNDNISAGVVAKTVSITGNTGSIGDGATIDIRPKYYALAYIMFKG